MSVLGDTTLVYVYTTGVEILLLLDTHWGRSCLGGLTQQLHEGTVLTVFRTGTVPWVSKNFPMISSGDPIRTNTIHSRGWQSLFWPYLQSGSWKRQWRSDSSVNLLQCSSFFLLGLIFFFLFMESLSYPSCAGTLSSVRHLDVRKLLNEFVPRWSGITLTDFSTLNAYFGNTVFVVYVSSIGVGGVRRGGRAWVDNINLGGG